MHPLNGKELVLAMHKIFTECSRCSLYYVHALFILSKGATKMPWKTHNLRSQLNHETDVNSFQSDPFDSIDM